ncbi:MAG TPA: ATP phosphoribosyltransferase [Rhodothermales bacterium]|nr:ATP phosphoribosyltransferase [Rhodothermales bacterium]
MLQIALPNKGALSEDAVDLVRAAGYRCRRSGRELLVRDAENGVEFLFLRPRDIAIYVSNGVLDLGITGRDLLADSDTAVEELLPLRFGKAAFYYAVPKDSSLTPEGMAGHRIATSYPNLVAQDLAQRGLDAQIVQLDGAVEISIQLGVADAIADVVQTGRTLDEAGLMTVGNPILRTEAILVARDPEVVQHNGVRLFVERLRGIIVAREYVMVEYDVPQPSLDAAVAITPGIESPTVAPLSKEGWLAVKAMARQKDINRIMDALTEIGAKGILITDIRTCRI